MFRHEAPFDRSSLTRWRQRLGEEQIAALLQESLSVAHRTGAIESKDLERVVVDTTVQQKAIAHPTDARLTHRAIEKLVETAKREGVELRQSYLRVAKRAAIMVGRYTHAHQFKRARRQLKFLRTRLGRIIRDVRRKIEGDFFFFFFFFFLGGGGSTDAVRVRLQGVDCHASHRAQRRTVRAACQGAAWQSVPCDMLGPVITDLEKRQVLLSAASTATRAIAATTIPTGSGSGLAGQVRRVTKVIRREMRRRAAVEPVTGHLKDDHRMRRNYLKGRDGDRINAVLAAAG